MNIGINGYYLNTPYSGIGQYTRNNLYYLSLIDSKNKYYIFTPKRVDFDLPDNFKQIVVKTSPFFMNTFINRFIWEEFQLGLTAKKYKLDIFHAFYQSLPRYLKIPLIVTIHDATPWRFPFERKNFLYRWYSDVRRKLVAKRAFKIIAISEASKLDFASIYGIRPEKIDVVYESCDPIFFKKPKDKDVAEFRKKFEIKKDFILYTGGLKRHKNLRMLIKSFAILKEKHDFLGELYIIGAIRKTMPISFAIYSDIDELKKYAKLKKVDTNIHFVGVVDKHDMNLFMHEASCFVSLSLHEGFGLPALEAMASGCPVVLSKIDAFSEIANGAGKFVYAYGPNRVARAIYEVISNSSVRGQMVIKGNERAKIFDGKTIAKRLIEIYREQKITSDGGKASTRLLRGEVISSKTHSCKG